MEYILLEDFLAWMGRNTLTWIHQDSHNGASDKSFVSKQNVSLLVGHTP
jgi:hypothetical protein